MADIVYTLQNVKKVFGLRVLFEDVNLSFLRNARIGVIGPNGMGKSTLLKIIAGEDEDYDGVAKPRDGLTIGYVAQEPKLDESLTVRENIDKAVEPIRQMTRDYEALTEKMADPDIDADEMEKLIEKMGRLQDEIDAKDAWELDRQIDQAMHALQCPPNDSPVTKLSGGERRRVALCRTLMEHPDLLLLDEPTNHLDADTVRWLEAHLQNYDGTIVLVTHDRYFLDNVVGWMLEVDRGTATPYEGNYTAYLEARQEHMRQRSKSNDKRAAMISRELDWIRQNPKGRTTKSKARVAKYDDLVAEHRKHVKDESEFRLTIPFTRKLGGRVMNVRQLEKTYGDRTLFSGLEFELPPGAILGVVGANGTGKTTLMRIVVGQETPEKGEVEIGETVDLCYLDQSREKLEPTMSVFDAVTGGTDMMRVGDETYRSRAYLARFNFRGQEQEKQLGTLSGGERNRVQMAKMLARGGNVIILDEPTNDLDLPTLRVLEEALLEFPGCVIMVTHDRFFMDRIATHILAFEGDGQVHFHPGNYESWVEHKKQKRIEAGLSAEEAVGTHRRFN